MAAYNSNSPAPELFAFGFDNKAVRSLIINDKPYFVGVDVGEAMGIENERQQIAKLDEDQRLVYVVHTSGQQRKVTLISESGLYALAFQSRKPETKRFCKIVTDVVLPSIRKYGFYIPDTNGIEGKLKDIAFDYFGDGRRKGYQYRAALRALGLNPNSTYANNRMKLFPKDFYKRDGIWFICEKYLEVLAINKAYRQGMQPLKQHIKSLPTMGFVQLEGQLNLFATDVKQQGGVQ